MSVTSEVSSILGRYMLLGWTLTDVNCRRPNCIGCPLMRSKDGIEFCARCDREPGGSGSPIGTGASLGDKPMVDSSPSSSVRTRLSEHDNKKSGIFTPPTPLLGDNRAQDGLEIDRDDDDDDDDEWISAPIADRETLQARRLQSDLASSRIGNLLLKGWILLNGQCQGSDCWGVPLMRSPKNSYLVDSLGLKRKYCVICEQDWESGDDPSKRERSELDMNPRATSQQDLEPLTSTSWSIEPTTRSDTSLRVKEPVARAKRDLKANQTSISSNSATNHQSLDTNDTIEVETVINQEEINRSKQLAENSSTRCEVTKIARDSLAETVKILSRKLVANAERSVPDLTTVVSTAESLQKVLAAYRAI